MPLAVTAQPRIRRHALRDLLGGQGAIYLLAHGAAVASGALAAPIRPVMTGDPSPTDRPAPALPAADGPPGQCLGPPSMAAPIRQGPPLGGRAHRGALFLGPCAQRLSCSPCGGRAHRHARSSGTVPIARVVGRAGVAPMAMLRWRPLCRRVLGHPFWLLGSRRISLIARVVGLAGGALTTAALHFLLSRDSPGLWPWSGLFSASQCQEPITPPPLEIRLAGGGQRTRSVFPGSGCGVGEFGRPAIWMAVTAAAFGRGAVPAWSGWGWVYRWAGFDGLR